VVRGGSGNDTYLASHGLDRISGYNGGSVNLSFRLRPKLQIAAFRSAVLFPELAGEARISGCAARPQFARAYAIRSSTL
jgi:hypothetical protein